MDIDFNLHIKQEQKLIITDEMKLSIEILQIPSYDLEKLIYKELEENPLLEIQVKDADKCEKYKQIIKNLDGNGYNYYNNYNEEYLDSINNIVYEKNLKEYLKEQVIDLDNDTKLRCYYIIENIDVNGYLSESIENMAKSLKQSIEKIKIALKIIQSLEPDGVGARDLKECLKIQCYKKNVNDKNIYHIIDNNLKYIGENNYSAIAKELNISLIKAQNYGDFIKTLEPKPAKGFYTDSDIKYIFPDAYIRKIGNDYYIIMNDDLIPKLTVNNLYKNIINNDQDKDAVNYVKDRLNKACILINSIQQRKTTIYKVLCEILNIQRRYFEYGDNYLKPMTLREVADKLKIHESTVSRAIKDKYINTPRGVIKIKDLFTNALVINEQNTISSLQIKNNIRKIISNEDKTNPLSDQKIAEDLKDKGVNISRRTVAKYREELGIKSSKGRRRY